MCHAAKCTIFNYWIFPLYEVKFEWGNWNQVLLEKQVCIALEWKQLYHYQTAQSVFLQSFPFSLPFWSVALCIIKSPMVPLLEIFLYWDYHEILQLTSFVYMMPKNSIFFWKCKKFSAVSSLTVKNQVDVVCVVVSRGIVVHHWLIYFQGCLRIFFSLKS